MTKYKVRFEAMVVIEAEDQAEAVRRAWLNETLKNAIYRMLDVEEAER